MESQLVHLIKNVYRFIIYNDERRRFFRERNIIKEQDTLIKKYDKNTEKLILFFVPGADRKTGLDTISGGVTSLVSLCEESQRLKDVHDAVVLMTVFPREYLLLKHHNFENNLEVFRFEQLPEYFTNVKHIIIHIPEFLITHFSERLFNGELKWLSNIQTVHINVINANILLMPAPELVHQLESIANKVTITAAHTKYCTPYYRKLYGYPLHKFSAWISPEQYNFVRYEDKEDMIVVSPDKNEHREQILRQLSKTNLKIIVLEKLTYKAFKEIIGRAKWALTFGEGLDGYILEPIFSGTIGFAVYNEEFFTPDFAELKTIYSSFDTLVEKIEIDMQNLGNEKSYTLYQKQQFNLCQYYYNFQQYQDNIAAFYKEEYTYK